MDSAITANSHAPPQHMQNTANIGNPGRQLKKQNNQDETGQHQKSKGTSQQRPAFISTAAAANSTAKKQQQQQMVEAQSPKLLNTGEASAGMRRMDKQSLGLEMVAISSNEGLNGESANDHQEGNPAYNQLMTPYGQGGTSGPGVNKAAAKSNFSDGIERRQNNMMGVSQSVGATGSGANASSGSQFNSIYKPTSKNDGNLSMGHNQNGSVSSNQNGSRGRVSGNGISNTRTMGASLNGDAARRKRKSSEKRQRRTSNNRKNEQFKEDDKKNTAGRDQNGVIIPPIDQFQHNQPGGGGAAGHISTSLTRSQSRSTNAGPNGQMQPIPNHPNMHQQPQSQPFVQNNQEIPFHLFGGNMHQQHSGEDPIQQNGFNVNFGNMGLGGVNLPNHQNFQFGNNNSGQFMGGHSQAPQVHFIAKKQQFIAQISPDQLLSSDKRPYTAQSLNNFSQSAKRAGAVYTNTYGKGSSFPSGQHLATAAFGAQPAIYLGQIGSVSKTHTNGFSFHPQSQNGSGSNQHKYSNSMYGNEDVKPKIAGKDILHALGSSNGFSSGYSSDPYNSVMSSGLPATITHSNRPTKQKTGNRFQTKEKEQLYDETIKMKVLNNQLRDESVKLKTKIKILENELNRKEKTIEDLFSHNQLIQQSHAKNNSSSTGSSLLPLAQTAQKYQQETFLVMSLKKQIRELKYEVVKRDEELEVLRKNIRNTKTKELEQEIQSYREECLRQRSIIEDLLKQGASHPIHQQAYHDQLSQLQIEIQQKDQIIQSMKDQVNQSNSLKLDTTAYQSGQSNGPLSANNPLLSATNAAVANTAHSTSMGAMRSQESHQLESSPSGPDVTMGMQALSMTHTAGQSFHTQQQNNNHTATVGREKSAEKKSLGAGGATANKELQRDLQRAKKSIREKDKEIVKLRSEVNQIRRESQEKMKNDNQQQKDTESQVKQLREKQRDLKMEIKRKDDKISESEIKSKKLEEQLKEVNEALKQQEDSNKTLKKELRIAKNSQKAQAKTVEQKVKMTPEQTPQTLKDDKKELQKVKEKEKEMLIEQTKEISADLKSVPSEPESVMLKKLKEAPKEELKAITLIGQREKLSRDDLTAMMMSGEESLRMLIRQPSEDLISFIKAHLDDEDTIVISIPKYEIPKSDFESQVLREMRLVLRDNADKIADKSQEELMKMSEFEEFYNGLENFDYPHKDKLLDFIKYFFLDHIEKADVLQLNYQAFKEHVSAKRPLMSSAERTRNASSLRSRRRSGDSASFSGSAEDSTKRRFLGLSEEDRADEEKMLDVAEQCFMRIADLLHSKQKTVKQVFLRFSDPEPFKDGTILELIPPRGFVEGVREVGFDDITEMEIACLMKVLAKPELDGAIILNEFTLIMENFGVPVVSDEEEQENDYIPDSDTEQNNKSNLEQKDKKPSEGDDKDKTTDKPVTEVKKEQKESKKAKESDDKKKDEDKVVDKDMPTNDVDDMKKRAELAQKGKKGKHPIILDFDILDEKGIKILKKLARFLLERYMHPREFFGPTIKKEVLGKKKNKVEIIKLHDFYLRLKLASIRKKLKENVTINQFVAIDGDKYPEFVQVKRMIKALEIIAEGEQEIMIKEQEIKEKERKEEAEKIAKERAEKGLPPLEEEDLKKEKEEEDEKKKKKPAALDINASKPPAGSRGMLDEMLKLGGRGSPQNSRDRESNRFGASGVSGPLAQLNTIEEDLHETQTSHYSQAIKEGDMTDREGSKHQLSTSNNLRNSNTLHELEDSSRRSATAIGIQPPPVDDKDAQSQAARTNPSKLTHKALDVRNSVSGCPEAKRYQLIDLDEAADYKLKDELDAEVDKQYQRQLASSRQGLDPLEDDYEDDFDNKDDKNKDDEEMKEDTIKTDMIEQLVEEDMLQKHKESKHSKMPSKTSKFEQKDDQDESAASNMDGQILKDLDAQSLDELDIHADQEGGSSQKPQNVETFIDRLDMNFEEEHHKVDVEQAGLDGDMYNEGYSEADEITNSAQNIVKQQIASFEHSEVDEDYEI